MHSASDINTTHRSPCMVNDSTITRTRCNQIHGPRFDLPTWRRIYRLAIMVADVGPNTLRRPRRSTIFANNATHLDLGGTNQTHTRTSAPPPLTPPPPPPLPSPNATSLMKRNRCHASRDRALLHVLDIGGRGNAHSHTHMPPPHTPPPPPPPPSPPLTSPLIERNRCHASRDRALLHGLDI